MCERERSVAGEAGAWLRLLRPEQWVKNGLLFLPLVLAHGWGDGAAVLRVVEGMVYFSLAASAVYVLNDFVDVEADRAHLRKCRRPLASGAVRRGAAPPLALGLGAAALAGGWLRMPVVFFGLLAGYLGMNLAYSFWCKRVPVLDVVLLTQMYVVRILAGGAAAGVAVTDWLVGFSLFQFLSIAFAKRYVELAEARASGAGESDVLRGYRVADAALVRGMGMTSGLLAVLVMALYIRSPDVLRLYAAPKVLWLMCPALIYWTGRLWLKADRLEMTDDPVAFTLRDGASYATGLFMAAVVLAARWMTL